MDDNTKKTLLCSNRISRDVLAIFKDPPPGLFIFPDEKNITLIHALIIGPAETPYESGFFYLLLRFPKDYPFSPPDVKFMTTGEGKVTFNPHMYSSGEVCLSILGTWSGPCWSPAQNLRSVLISIQSLLNQNPFLSGPSLREDYTDDYNQQVRHETLRVAVCDMLEGVTADSKNLPKPLKTAMEKSFLDRYDYYESIAKANTHLNEKKMLGLFKTTGVFNYASILMRLQKIKKKMTNIQA